MNSKWLRCRFKRTKPSVYLICFPWAGGGTSYYTGTWSKLFPEHVEGREGRFKEPFLTEWTTLISDLCDDIYNTLGQKHPFIFWGHSMGAVMCFEAARCLKTKHGIEPMHLLISSASAPQVVRKSPRSIAEISNEQLADKIRNWGGTPQAILDNKEIMDISVRILRADLTLVENYRFIVEDSFVPVLSCPITCFDGKDDLRDQEGWSEMTTGHFVRHVLSGGHFYFMKNQDNENQLVDIIKQSFPSNT
ncbi:S-acyl fatty acid synthase thioesterase, medium chain isoform X2 [Exaiptasia diaphana]|uniref:oleoyl-[acyl-carrier-protein] hydrolase n=1 Tax=Exaiptasia diaphana TaxID=2652724 RepID=A0A913WXZ3_EXADI|nr:S-acyl fatty acid synthase thioesterase, medium chain isoform X2 [Exaiptasia diaphana]